MTWAVLDEVNEQRFGKKYADEDAAIEILGSPNKKPLTKTKSPFLLYLSTERTKKVIGPIKRTW